MIVLRHCCAAATAILAIVGSAPAQAQAWWNGDWAQREKIGVNAGAGGAALGGPLSQVPVLVRLHSGNLDFTRVKPDGSDLRFVSADGKIPLKYHIEKWDPASEIALVWVLLPTLAPAQPDASIWMYYGNPKAPKADDPKGTYDAQFSAVYHFGENEGSPRDSTGFANNAATGPDHGSASLIGNGLIFAAGDALQIPVSPSLKFSPSGGFTFSAWVKPLGKHDAVLFLQKEGDKALSVSIAGGELSASVSGGRRGTKAAGGAITPDAWHHVAVTAGKRLVLYVDGTETGSADGEMPEIQAAATIGQGFAGEMDEVEISSVARSADFIRVAARSQGPDAALLAFQPGEEGGGSSTYFGILLGSVTPDGWVVIAILIVMGVISGWVMVAKTLYVNRCESENRAFLQAFRTQGLQGERLLDVDFPQADSCLAHVYRVGVEEVKGRINGANSAAAAALSAKAIESVRATLDAAQVRENQKLNRFMVLLTIAISGGPFLGLLGTVIGIMITFAAIAATGDVNVAAIAPGIAAALVATVAGLAVAIPSLFGYNYIGTRIKNVSADMRVFADEFLTRLAESHGV